MFQLITQISEVDFFQTKEKSLLYAKKDGKFYFNTKEIVIHKPITGGSLLSEDYIIVNTENEQIILDSLFTLIKQIDNKTLITDIFYNVPSNKVISFNTEFLKNGDINCHWGALNILADNIIDDFNITTPYCNPLVIKKNRIYFHFHNKKIVCYEIRTGQTLWSFELDTKYNWFAVNTDEERENDILKFVSTYDNNIWMCLGSGKLLAISSETGKAKYYLTSPTKFINKQFDFPDEEVGVFGYGTQFDISQSIIFGSISTYYGEVDLKSPLDEYFMYDISTSCKQHKIQMDRMVGFEGDEIYFYEGGSNNRFGVFSRSKKEIIWSSEIPEAKDQFPAIKKMEYSNSKLYILDYFDTLHIFEKE